MPMPTTSTRKLKRLVAATLALWLLPLGTHASVEDFHFDSFHAEYRITTDADGLATLNVQETLVPVFPTFDQNRGLIRYLPSWYNRMPLETEVLSLTDENGVPRPLEVFSDSGYLAVDSVVPEGEYLHGQQSFVLSYRQQNVIGDFTDSSGYQEFYWDLNGTGWSQRFDTVSAQIMLDTRATSGLVPEASACYFGSEGDTNRCELSFTSDGNSTLVSVQQNNLQPNETVTVALAFEPGTFTVLTRNASDYLLNWLLFPLLIALITVVALALRYNLKVLSGAPGRKVILTEYLPPKEVGLEHAAQILSSAASLPVAKLLELAVAGKIQITERTKAKWGKSSWAIILMSEDLSKQDQEVLEVLFGDLPKIGMTTPIPKSDASLSKRLAAFMESLKAATRERFYVATPIAPRVFFTLSSLVLGATGLTLALISIANRYGNGLVITAVVLFCALGLLGAVLVSRSPLNSEGAEARDHLKGLKVYMKLAEQHRLEFLQSPTGALVGEGGYLKLHEKLLPWAVVLGLGKTWMKELGALYGDQQPVWLVSNNHSSFYGAMTSLSSATSASFGSSTSGGAGGAGGAGGGGGGGGGGGR